METRTEMNSLGKSQFGLNEFDHSWPGEVHREFARPSANWPESSQEKCSNDF